MNVEKQQELLPFMQYYLEKKTVGMMVKISPVFASTMKLKIQSLLDEASEDLVIGVRGTMLVQVMETDVFLAEYPENWIEAVKDRFLPAWVQKYWPIKYHKIVKHVEHWAKYPHADLVIPKDQVGMPYFSFHVRTEDSHEP